jgi:hypothetical protein
MQPAQRQQKNQSPATLARLHNPLLSRGSKKLQGSIPLSRNLVQV